MNVHVPNDAQHGGIVASDTAWSFASVQRAPPSGSAAANRINRLRCVWPVAGAGCSTAWPTSPWPTSALHTRHTSAGPRRPLYGHADRVEDLLRWITTCAYGMLVCSCLAASCYVGGACAGSEADGTVFAPYRARTSPITSLLMGICTVSTGVINSLSQSSPTRTLFASVGIFAR